MKLWKVFLRYTDNGIIMKNLDLIDISSFFGGYLKIKRSYFNELIKMIKISKKYITKKAIEKVIASESDEDWTNNPWMIIVAKDNEKGMPFWFLIKRERDLSGSVIAIGPKEFAQYNEKQSISDARREIKKIISYIISYVNKFECLILLPNYLK